MQDSDSVLRQAGDVNIEKVLITTRSGVSQEVTPQVIAISYYEDLFSPFYHFIHGVCGHY